MAQTTFNAVARRLLQLKLKAWSILVVSQELSTILSKIWFQHAAIIKEKGWQVNFLPALHYFKFPFVSKFMT